MKGPNAEMKSHVVSSSPHKSVYFRAGDLYAASSIDVCDDDDNIVGYHGVITRWSGGAETRVHSSMEDGFIAVAVITDGRIVAAVTDYSLLVLTPDGQIERRIDTELGAEADWLEVGGAPERVFAATTSSSSSKRHKSVVELSTKTWETKYVRFDSTFAPCISEVGVSRVTKDKRIAEWAWKGAPKPKTEPLVTYGTWKLVRVDGGWFLYDGTEPKFVDVSGKVAWNANDLLPKYSNAGVATRACAAGGNRLLVATPVDLLLLDGPTGELLASCLRKTRLTDDGNEGKLAWDGATGAALASSAGLEIVTNLPALDALRSPRVAVTVPKPKPGRSEHDATVETLEALAERLCAAEDAAGARKVYEEVEALDVFAARDDERLDKRIDKVVRRLEAHVRKSKNDAVNQQIMNVLDTLTST